MKIKMMMQAISSFINLGDGCCCTIAYVEIRLDEGRIAAVVRNGADDVYVTNIYIIDQFGERFMCSTTSEPNIDYDIVFNVRSIDTFKDFNDFTNEMYGCTYSELCSGDWSWEEILSNFIDVKIDIDINGHDGIGTDQKNPLASDNVASIAKILSLDRRWN